MFMGGSNTNSQVSRIMPMDTFKRLHFTNEFPGTPRYAGTATDKVSTFAVKSKYHRKHNKEMACQDGGSRAILGSSFHKGSRGKVV